MADGIAWLLADIAREFMANFQVVQGASQPAPDEPHDRAGRPAASAGTGSSSRGETGSRHGGAFVSALLAAAALLSAAAPVSAQSMPPSSLDLNVRALGEMGAIAPAYPGSPPSAAWGTGGRYGAAEMFGRAPERALPHMPPAPMRDGRR